MLNFLKLNCPPLISWCCRAFRIFLFGGGENIESKREHAEVSFSVHYDLLSHCSGGKCKRLLVVHVAVKRLTTVAGSKWRQVLVASGLSCDLSALHRGAQCVVLTFMFVPVIRAKVRILSSAAPCLYLSPPKKWWYSVLLSMAATEPPLDSWHVSSPGLISDCSKLWHKLCFHMTGLESGSTRQGQWHHWGGTLTSLRRNSDLAEDAQSKAGQPGDHSRFYQQYSNH